MLYSPIIYSPINEGRLQLVFVVSFQYNVMYLRQHLINEIARSGSSWMKSST